MIPDVNNFSQDFDFDIDSKGIIYDETGRSFVNPKHHTGKAYLIDILDTCEHEALHYPLNDGDLELDEKHHEWIIETLAKLDEKWKPSNKLL